jgi:hypothetical protein
MVTISWFLRRSIGCGWERWPIPIEVHSSQFFADKALVPDLDFAGLARGE